MGGMGMGMGAMGMGGMGMNSMGMGGMGMMGAGNMGMGRQGVNPAVCPRTAAAAMNGGARGMGMGSRLAQECSEEQFA